MSQREYRRYFKYSLGGVVEDFFQQSNPQTHFLSPLTSVAISHPTLPPPSHPPKLAAIRSAAGGFTQWACHPGRMAPCRWSRCGGRLQRSSLSWTFMIDLAPGRSFLSQAQTRAALGSAALTGGAQQALNAAINLHHGRFEGG